MATELEKGAGNDLVAGPLKNNFFAASLSNPAVISGTILGVLLIMM